MTVNAAAAIKIRKRKQSASYATRTTRNETKTLFKITNTFAHKLLGSKVLKKTRFKTKNITASSYFDFENFPRWRYKRFENPRCAGQGSKTT